MPRRTTELLLEDIASSLDKIASYVYGLDQHEFMGDDKTTDAVVRNLEIIGEAVKNLPESFKAANPALSWQQIAGLRNRIVHDYAGIDLEIIWEIVSKALPEFSVQIAVLRGT